MSEKYTPGYTANAVDFMSRRTAQTHAAFLLPHLKPGMRLLDCGCGPGSITLGLARAIGPGQVIGVDQETSQLELARENFKQAGLTSATFQQASVYELPFSDSSFDVVFAHAVFEHLKEPGRALSGFRRVLAPGGIVALKSPDWGGFIFHPATAAATRGVHFYMKLQGENGGDVFAGRKLKAHLLEAGFERPEESGSYEVYQPIDQITEFIALRIEDSVTKDHSIAKGWTDPDDLAEMCDALRTLARTPGGVFMTSWCSVVARKAESGCG